MKRYRYRDNVTNQLNYIDSLIPPSGGTIKPNTVTYIKDVGSGSGGGGIQTFYINLIGNTDTIIANTLILGTYNITIKKQIPMDEAPCGSFIVAKIKNGEDANINEVNNVTSNTTNEKLFLQWLNGQDLQCKKENTTAIPDNTFDGTYIVNII